MQKAIIGKKVGMTQIFDETGKVIPVTVIEAGPCVVTQKKTLEQDGYVSVQLGFENVKESKLTKPEAGHLKKAGVEAKKHLKEFKLDAAADMNVGDVIKADTFAAGDKVDVVGTSKGHGYQGVVKRWNAGRTPMTHGGGPVHRHAGSMGSSSDPSRIFKGKIAGHPRRHPRPQGRSGLCEVHCEEQQDQARRCRHQQEPAEGFRTESPEGFRQRLRKGELKSCLRRMFTICPASRSARSNSPKLCSALSPTSLLSTMW